MFIDLVVSAAFVVVFLAFWYLQLFTRYLSTRYYLQVGLLLSITVSSAYLAIRLVALSGASPQWWAILGMIALAGVAIYHGGLFFVKFVMETDTRYRRIRKANRAVVTYSSPHNRFQLRTDDGVKIQALALCNQNGDGKSRKAVVICHGAGRSKNTIPIVQTAQILATKYDVYPFDFRGHNESGGIFRADGDTELDLKAMLDYLKGQAYEKIAVVGWSIGAWTALLSASLGRPIDAIIAGAPPPRTMTALWYIRNLERVRLLYPPLLASIAVVRGMWVTAGKHVLNTEEFSRNVPPIPVLLVHNEFDYLLHEPGTAFDNLFKALPPTTERYVLPGTGHLFDWPNTYFLWNKIIDWLDRYF